MARKKVGTYIDFKTELDSTNSYLNELLKAQNLVDGYTVVAKNQTGGKGQTGKKWISEDGLNLTFSTLIKTQLQVQHAYLLNVFTSLAIRHALQDAGVQNLTVKWPNDIWAGHQKICGILIENQIQGAEIQCSTVGIGINVNQQKFSRKIPNPTSVILETGRFIPIDHFLETVLDRLDDYLELTKKSNYDLFDRYNAVLYQRSKQLVFKGKDAIFEGEILFVNKLGQLVVKLKSGARGIFNHGEIEMLTPDQF